MRTDAEPVQIHMALVLVDDRDDHDRGVRRRGPDQPGGEVRRVVRDGRVVASLGAPDRRHRHGIHAAVDGIQERGGGRDVARDAQEARAEVSGAQGDGEGSPHDAGRDAAGDARGADGHRRSNTPRPRATQTEGARAADPEAKGAREGRGRRRELARGEARGSEHGDGRDVRLGDAEALRGARALASMRRECGEVVHGLRVPRGRADPRGQVPAHGRAEVRRLRDHRERDRPVALRGAAVAARDALARERSRRGGGGTRSRN
mmetsp:Transcript_3420/g.11557  ORF Transcript_3420/g.11557 Transcript_3420/m.11557 type:complete len:262 (-) Transcript_3420:40-825(-)